MLAWLLTLALAVLVAVRVLGVERGTVLALLVGALPITLLPVYLLLALACFAGRRRLALLCGVLVAAHVAVITPTLGASPLPAGTDAAPRLRIVVSNLYVDNPTPERAGQALRALHPDVLVVPELTRAGLAGLRRSGLLTDLPYAVVEVGDGETTGLLSRVPLSHVSLRAAGGRRLPRASVDVGGTSIALLAAHPYPPILPWEGLWRTSFRDLAAEARSLSGPAVIAGDFNADRDHAPFRQLLGAGLTDAHDDRGRGLARTWPARFPVLQLDHVLVHDGPRARVVVRSVRESRVPGSDHLAVVADLAVLRR